MNTALVAESFILNEPADGSVPHLVSILRDPERAAALPGTRGSVQLRYHSLHLIPVDLIDDVPGIWAMLLHAAQGYLADGKAEVPYPGLDAVVLIEGTAAITKFTAGKVRHIVDAGQLIDGIASGAEAYFRFAPGLHQDVLARIQELRSAAAAMGLFAQA